MSEDGTSIGPDEPILRRIIKSPGYYDPIKAPPVEAGAFRPNDKDVDGLSFYLERKLSVSALIEAASKPADHYIVARFRAGDLHALNLSLIPDEQPGDLPGHLIVPEINWVDYHDSEKKRRIKEWCFALARLASKGIVE